MNAETAGPIAVVAAISVAGWWRFVTRGGGRIPRWRPAVGLAAIAVIGVALASPLDALARERFTAHMVQHMLLVMVAAPALLLADPLPALLWGLPRRARSWIGRSLAVGAPLRALWRTLTRPTVAWLVYAVTLWLWHLPALYDLALAHDALHHVEHLAFFGAAIVFWAPVVNGASRGGSASRGGPAPRVGTRASPAGRIAYVVLAAFQTAALGLVLTWSPEPLYASYAGLAGVDALEDQALGGVVMWAGSAAIDMAAVMALLFRFFTVQDAAIRQALP